MRRGDRSLKKSAQKFSKEKVSVKATYFGELGITLGGAQVVNVPGRAGFVFARLNGNTSELVQALNTTVPSAYGLNVQIQRDGQNYKIIGRDVQVYSNQGTQLPGGTSPLPQHGAQHSFAPELGMGADVTWVFSRQFMPLLIYPSGSSNLLTLSPAFYEWEGSWRYAQTTGAINLTPYVPTATGSARMALVYINPATNGIEVLGGPPFSNSITSPSSLAGLIPDVDRNNSIPLAAIKLTTGTNAISWTQIYDLRDFYTVSKHWAGMGFQNGGVPLGTGTSLNFGTNLSATLLNGVVTVNATAGGGGGGLGFVAQSDGLFLVTGTTLNFVGAGVQASVSGSTVRVQVNSPVPLPSGRISPVSGMPVLNSTVTGSSTMYWNPYKGQSVPIYNGTAFVAQDMGGILSQALSDGTKSPTGTSPNKNYDYFIWDDAGTYRCTRGPAWSSDTDRGSGPGTTEINPVMGIYVNSNAITNGPTANRGTYVGTIRTNGSNQVDYIFGGSSPGGIAGFIGVWNMYNRVMTIPVVHDTTVVWTFSSATQVALNSGGAGSGLRNRISYVLGLAEDTPEAFMYSRTRTAAVNGAHCFYGIGKDSTTVIATFSTVLTLSATAIEGSPPVDDTLQGQLGFHFVQAMQQGDGTNTSSMFGGGNQNSLLLKGFF